MATERMIRATNIRRSLDARGALAELVIVRVPLTIRSLSLSAFVLWMNVEPALRLPPFLHPPRAFSLHLSVTDWPSSVSPLPSLSPSCPLAPCPFLCSLFLAVSPSFSLSFPRSLFVSLLSSSVSLSSLPCSAAQRSRTRSVAAVDPYAAKHRNTSAHWPRLLASPTDSRTHRGAVLRSTSVRNRCKLFTLGLSRLYRWRAGQVDFYNRPV